jgi:CRP/FNR family transcriptional activator FtrB
MCARLSIAISHLLNRLRANSRPPIAGPSRKLKGYVARSSVQRLANWILSEARTEASGTYLVLPFDRATLASHIGTTRENLSRNLAQLTDHGVRIRGREIVIDRKDLLQAFARPQRLIDDPNS